MKLLCILLLACFCSAVSPDSILLPVAKDRVASIDVAAECPKFRIAVVNGVKFHFEILSGLLHVLKPYQKYVDVFLGPYIRTQNYDGAWDLVRWSKARFYKTDINLHSHNVTYDLVILVSPEYELELSQRIVAAMRPRLTTGRKADWMLSVFPFQLSETDCAMILPSEQVLGMCVRGFSMQGKFSNLRRNYTSIWTQMQRRVEELDDPQIGKYFHLSVLGKGPNRLALPIELEQFVTVHQRQVYKVFYNIIAHTMALVPSLANPKKTVKMGILENSEDEEDAMNKVSKMAIGKQKKLQLIVPEYQRLQTEDSEDEVDAMIRVSKMAGKDIFVVREKLAVLREEFNERSFKMLEGYIRRSCGPSALDHVRAGGFLELE
eukprot:gene23059-30248_t